VVLFNQRSTKLKGEYKDMNYFIADLHFGHKNVLSFDARPFKTIEDHDVVLITNWNDIVGLDDDVYILGDISWYNATKTIEIFKQLNGKKHLIVGNHDNKLIKNKELQKEFEEICNYKELDIGKGNICVLSHYPIPCFKSHYYGAYHLYGHVHNSFEWNMMKRFKYELEELYTVPCNMYNVGCMIDYMGYRPRTLDEIVNANVR